ncbi:glucosamine-6-phosphate deaminase [Amphibacillus cookii]|uniref:glucosamine-6-phosphate deaminase n=1 Tax=Amphibacillus cookii TaxID=767787 RepID=UPI00195E6E46|nr:glucosamine-6-phosphate deaminase [Amphibacillus cookii]MBM7540916.1 glucosamine-6-phosphate deaminase [Amphibacillus cookii]
MNIIKVDDYQAMSQWACQHIIGKINQTNHPVLGLATGSTPEGMYQCLIDSYQAGFVSFKDVTTFNLDEYVGLAIDDPNSYHSFMQDKLFNHINIREEQTHLPNGNTKDHQQECKDYERLIQQAKSIDLQILGIGLNGHIGFNEPGTPFTSRTHVVELDPLTREANARFFNQKQDVPTHAITMGIETIMESKEIVLLVSGANKAEAVKRLVTGELSESFPASILKQHDNLTIVVDQAAAVHLN